MYCKWCDKSISPLHTYVHVLLKLRKKSGNEQIESLIKQAVDIGVPQVLLKLLEHREDSMK